MASKILNQCPPGPQRSMSLRIYPIHTWSRPPRRKDIQGPGIASNIAWNLFKRALVTQSAKVRALWPPGIIHDSTRGLVFGVGLSQTDLLLHVI